MIVNSTIKNKRIKEMRNLYDLIVKDNENYKEILYKIIKETIEETNLEEKITNNIYDALTNAMGLTLAEARKMYKSFDESRQIELEHLLYSKDGKTLEQRIHSWMGEKNIMNLFYHLCLILDTETYQLIHQTIKEKVNIEYVEIIGDAECARCAEYCDGEVYPADEMELPPYHPGCLCEAIMYEKEDVLGDL